MAQKGKIPHPDIFQGFVVGPISLKAMQDMEQKKQVAAILNRDENLEVTSTNLNPHHVHMPSSLSLIMAAQILKILHQLYFSNVNQN